VNAWTVVFAPEAEDQLVSLYEYIANEQGLPKTAARYLDAIIADCESLAHLPHRGTRRDDIRPGLRITHHKHRLVIAFEADDASMTVSILGIFYGGRDFEGVLGEGGPV
jgi:plasmid stabilization system protein ParE